MPQPLRPPGACPIIGHPPDRQGPQAGRSCWRVGSASSRGLVQVQDDCGSGNEQNHAQCDRRHVAASGLSPYRRGSVTRGTTRTTSAGRGAHQAGLDGIVDHIGRAGVVPPFTREHVRMNGPRSGDRTTHFRFGRRFRHLGCGWTSGGVADANRGLLGRAVRQVFGRSRRAARYGGNRSGWGRWRRLGRGLRWCPLLCAGIA